MDLTQNQITFTPEELKAYVANFVETEYADLLAFAKKRQSSLRSYHTVTEIKDLILLNLSHLKSELDYEPFTVQAFTHCLRKLMVLRPGDLEILGDDKFRLNSQISQAIHSNWDQNPIELGSDHRSHLYWRALND
jgi:hypothetical protein